MVSETNAGVCLGDINIHQHHWGMNDNFINKKKVVSCYNHVCECVFVYDMGVNIDFLH